MKTFLILPALFLSGAAALAQTDPGPVMTNVPTAPRPHIVEVPQPDQPAPAAAEPQLDPAKLAEYQRRFQEGYALQQSGKLGDARTIYDSILAEQPQAKRSLLEAGRVSMLLGQPTKADEYLSKLHALVPDFPEAIELLIQANQQLKHDVKVELLIRDFVKLHDSGKIPELAQSLCFVRERIHSPTQDIVISQFFDYMREPNTVWMAEVFSPGGQIERRILLNYDADTTRALRAKDAKYATTQVFTWFEHKMTAGKVTEIEAYLQVFSQPDYAKFVSAMQIILANPPKPIYSAPVGGDGSAGPTVVPAPPPAVAPSPGQ